MADTESMTRMRAVIGRLARQLNATATGAGLTPTQASVLGLISVRGPLGLAELAELEGLNPTMLSRVVSKLGELGLISREQDPDDLRAARVAITPQGDEVSERIRGQRTDTVSRCLDRLPAETVHTLLDALPALEALAEELREETVRQRP